MDAQEEGFIFLFSFCGALMEDIIRRFSSLYIQKDARDRIHSMFLVRWGFAGRCFILKVSRGPATYRMDAREDHFILCSSFARDMLGEFICIFSFRRVRAPGCGGG